MSSMIERLDLAVDLIGFVGFQFSARLNQPGYGVTLAAGQGFQLAKPVVEAGHINKTWILFLFMTWIPPNHCHTFSLERDT